MPATRPRRIVRRAVMVLTGIVLLLASYISCFGLVCWIEGRDPLRLPRPVSWESPVFAPLDVYQQTEFPGAFALWKLTTWCSLVGHSGSGDFKEAWKDTQVEAELKIQRRQRLRDR